MGVGVGQGAKGKSISAEMSTPHIRIDIAVYIYDVINNHTTVKRPHP